PSTTTLSSLQSPQEEGDGDVSKNNSDGQSSSSLASNVRRAFLASSLTAVTYNIFTLGSSALGPLPKGYERVSPLQFIAALGDSEASSGKGAENWGLWPTDPGPRGLRLRDYERIIANNDESRPYWLDATDFFLDENAIIMPQPEYPLPPGKYLVTGARAVTTGLTIDKEGNWKLDEGKLYDVTHLPCRAGRYRRSKDGDGSPLTVRRGDFPVVPGGVMPNVPGTDKQDYSVLFILAKQGV
ncbi:hypothetical protein ACHAXR_001388, partial [Thalassiosira sp. AJA248-18]